MSKFKTKTYRLSKTKIKLKTLKNLIIILS